MPKRNLYLSDDDCKNNNNSIGDLCSRDECKIKIPSSNPTLSLIITSLDSN